MNFVFLVRSFVVNLVFLVIFLSKYVGQLPENGIFQEVDARICSKKWPKTPDSLQMIGRGTTLCSWCDHL